MPINLILGLALGSPAVSGAGWAPIPGAALDLDFVNDRVFGAASIASALTITRATTKYTQNATGLWVPVGSGALPYVGPGYGLLPEESRTNLFVTPLAPATQTITVVNGTAYSVSLFASGGTLTLSGAGSGTVNANGQVNFTASSTSLTVTCNSITGDFQCVNVEAGARGTSPIGSGTRNADAISVNSSSSFITANASGIYMKIRPRIVAGGGTRTFASAVIDGSNRHVFYINASTGTFNFSTVTASASQYFLALTGSMVAETSYKTAARWQANSAALRVSSPLTSPANNTSNTQPTGTPTIWLGSLSGSSTFANGYIERVAFFLSPPSDAVLDSLVA